MIMHIFEGLMLVLVCIVGIAVLIIASGGVLFGYIFGMAAIWIVRVILLIIIGKLLYKFIVN